MTLRVSLVIDGNASGAKKAAADTSLALVDLKKDGAQTAAALSGAFGSAGPSLAAFGKGATAAGASLKGVNDNVAGTARQARAEIINLGRQVQDVGVSLASGQSPLMVLVQQGAQIGDIFASSERSVGDFGKKIGAILTPTRLAIGAIGLIAGGSYLALESIKQTEKEFGVLSERTDTAVRSLHAFESAAAFKGIDTSDFLKSMQQFGELTDQAQQGQGSLATLFRANGVAVGNLNDNLLRGAELIRNAGGEAEKYRLVQQLGLPATREWVHYLSQGSEGLRQAAQGAVQFGGLADEHMVRKAREFDEAWDTGWKNFATNGKLAVLGAKGGLEDIRRWANRLGQDLSPHMLGLRLSNAFDDTGDYSNRAMQGALEKRAAEKRNGSVTSNPDVQLKQLALEQQRIGVLGQLATIQDTVRQSEIRIAQGRLAGVGITADEEVRIRSLAEAQALGTFAIRQQTDAARIEADSIGMSVGATAAFRAEQERLAAFRALGITLTKKQTDALHLEALALSEATTAAAKGRLGSDISFERSQIGRSSDEQQIASRLRGIYGDDFEKYMDGNAAATMRLNQQLQFTHDIGLTSYKGILSDLQQGKSYSEAFGNSLVNSLGKVSDKLAEMAYNNLWGAAFGGNSSGDAGIFGLVLSSIFGGGGGVLPGGSALGQGGIGHAAEGGLILGAGGPRDDAIPTMLSNGEFVTNAQSTAKHLALLTAINEDDVPHLADGGYVGPAVMPSSRSGRGQMSAGANEAGNSIDARTTIYADFRGADSGAVAEIGSKLDQLERSMPDLVVANVERALVLRPARVTG